MSKRFNLRAHATRILTSVVKNQQSLASLLPYQPEILSSQDQALLQELCFGVCRWYQRLNAQIDMLLDKPLKAKDTDVKVLLLLGLYQLEFTRIPAHAAISETVQACKQLKKASASGLINAILRRSQREKEAMLDSLNKKTDYLYSHPYWLIKRLKQAWPEHWQQICAANNERAPMSLRVNALRNNRADYLEKLNNANIKAQASPFSQHGINLEKPTNVETLPGFTDGQCSVQDEAAQLAATLLQLEPNQRVLDACAAPGGKTCHLLELQPQLASVTALELDADRAQRIHQNLERLQLSATVVEGDASQPNKWWDQQPYDRILLDAPCSATGVIRRHPDIKLLRRDDDITELAKLQLQILQALWPLLKPHGILLYATCSVLPEENEQVISTFLKQQCQAKILPFEADWGIPGAVGRQLFPQPQGHDGFYYARIQKQP
ncbi:Ribosomal RNA small subunit methyltransferase B [gamma proteobacterium IMCC2047]|nr:Ribosomal RNA small subunit methyltransferase B [gamma proteobacterium IMCC2047]